MTIKYFFTESGGLEVPEPEKGRRQYTVPLYKCKVLMSCFGWPDGWLDHKKKEFKAENRIGEFFIIFFIKVIN